MRMIFDTPFFYVGVDSWPGLSDSLSLEGVSMGLELGLGSLI